MLYRCVSIRLLCLANAGTVLYWYCAARLSSYRCQLPENERVSEGNKDNEWVSDRVGRVFALKSSKNRPGLCASPSGMASLRDTLRRTLKGKRK